MTTRTLTGRFVEADNTPMTTVTIEVTAIGVLPTDDTPETGGMLLPAPKTFHTNSNGEIVDVDDEEAEIPAVLVAGASYRFVARQPGRARPLKAFNAPVAASEDDITFNDLYESSEAYVPPGLTVAEMIEEALEEFEPPPAESIAWDDVTDKPATFTPSAHTHTIAETTGLQAALDGKSATGHTHSIGAITGAGTAAALNVAASGDAGPTEVVKGDDSRLGAGGADVEAGFVILDATAYTELVNAIRIPDIKYHPDRLPAGYVAANSEEFDVDPTGSGSWLNQGSSTIVHRNGLIRLDAITPADDYAHFLLPVPGTLPAEWTIRAKVCVQQRVSGAFEGGIVIGDSGGAMVAAHLSATVNDGKTYYIEFDNTGNIAANQGSLGSLAGTMRTVWVEFQRDATNLIVRASCDGREYITIQSRPRTSHLAGNVVTWGLYGYDNTEIHVMYLRRVA